MSEFLDDGGPQVAAGISYFTLFSLFPLAILTVAIFGLFLGGEEARERVIQFVLDRVPLAEDQGRRDLRQALTAVTRNAAAFGVVGILGLLFAASGLMGAIRNALNRAWDVADSRPPVQGKLLDMGLVLGVGVVVALSTALTFGMRLAASVGDELSDALGPVGSALAEVLFTLGQMTPIVVSFAVFAFLYRVIPAADVGLRDVWPGALLAALGFELAKTGFSFYLENFADYGAVYGSLATVVAFLVFVFVAANVMLVGAEAASEWRGVREGRIDAEEAAAPEEPTTTRIRRVLLGLVRRD